MKQSLIKYLGTKTYLINKFGFQNYIPVQSHSRTPYVELFCGSAVMFFNLTKKQQSYSILNDIDNDLINFWNTIRDNSKDFENELKYRWVGDNFISDLEDTKDKILKAVLFYLKNQRGDHTPMAKKLGFLRKDISEWAEMLNNARVKIWNRDYESVLTKLNKHKKDSNVKGHENDHYIIYEDPPYFATENMYKGEFKSEDHVKLAKLNNDSHHHIILSLSENPLVYELYPEDKWDIKKFTYSSRLRKTDKIELLISNRELVKREKSVNLLNFMKNQAGEKE